jgi:hypothetical protein
MNTDELITHARTRFDHATARRTLREKYQAKLTFAYAGGMWVAGPELLVMLATCPDETAVLLDLYKTPVKVDVRSLELAAQQRWQEQMNAWLEEYTELNKQR